MGAITDIVKRYVPASYRALVGVTNTYDYAIADLQALADFVQYRLYSTVAGSTYEDTVWNYSQRQLLGMLTTLQFIPAAIDFWGNQYQSQNLSGTEEDVSYFDRRPELWKVYERIASEAEKLGVAIGVNVTSIKSATPRVSYGDNGRGILLTPDPTDSELAFSPPNTYIGIPWSEQ